MYRNAALNDKLIPVTNQTVRYIGDVHGKISEYLTLLNGVDASVQVGDFGAGFVSLPILDQKHRFIRGNHDSPEVCRNNSNWIKDGTFDGRTLYIGGAWSIDQHRRIPGINWWEDEELSIREFENIIVTAEIMQPKVIVSHDCPGNVVAQLFRRKLLQTRTNQALDAVINVCQPKLFIFGHWHKDIDMTINGTRFLCLNELTYIDIKW